MANDGYPADSRVKGPSRSSFATVPMSGIEPAFVLFTREVLNHLASSAYSVIRRCDGSGPTLLWRLRCVELAPWRTFVPLVPSNRNPGGYRSAYS